MESPKSLEALEYLLGHENVEVRCVALDSLGERLGPDVLPYARRLGQGRQQEEKWWAETWIARFGNAEDVPFMAERVKRLLGGKRKRTYEPPEVSSVVPFLRRFAEVPEARAALEALREHAERLPENEREWIEAHAPEVLSATS